MIKLIFILSATIIGMFSLKDSFNFFIAPIFQLDKIDIFQSLGVFLFLFLFKIQIKPLEEYENYNVEKYTDRDCAIYALIFALYYGLINLLNYLYITF